MSALLGTIYVGELRTEKEKKVGRWHHTSQILVVAMYFSWSMKWIGEDTEKQEEQGKSYRSSTIHYTIDMIIFEEMPKLWLIKLYYQKYRL